MGIDIYQQTIQQLNAAKNVLIVLPKVLTADALSSGLALKLFLQKLGKDVEVASSQSVSAALSFLPAASEVKSGIKASDSLVINLDTNSTKLEELSYQNEDKQVQIFLKAKIGSFTPEDVSFSSQKFSVDIVVILDCASLEDLGEIFEKNADLFYQTPKINIDNKPDNEYFGSINLVEIAFSSVAEIVSVLIGRFEQQHLVDEDIATCLLAGIVTKTNSFQYSQTTPQALLKASELITLGGRHQEIIRQFYKTKPLAVLKLWGRALAHLKQDQTLDVIYSLVSFTDMEKSGAKKDDLSLVLQEMVSVIAERKIVALLAEVAKEQIQLLMVVQPEALAETVSRRFAGFSFLQTISRAPGLPQIINLKLPAASLAVAENNFLDNLKGL